MSFNVVLGRYTLPRRHEDVIQPILRSPVPNASAFMEEPYMEETSYANNNSHRIVEPVLGRPGSELGVSGNVLSRASPGRHASSHPVLPLASDYHPSSYSPLRQTSTSPRASHNADSSSPLRHASSPLQDRWATHTGASPAKVVPIPIKREQRTPSRMGTYERQHIGASNASSVKSPERTTKTTSRDAAGSRSPSKQQLALKPKKGTDNRSTGSMPRSRSSEATRTQKRTTGVAATNSASARASTRSTTRTDATMGSTSTTVPNASVNVKTHANANASATTSRGRRAQSASKTTDSRSRSGGSTGRRRDGSGARSASRSKPSTTPKTSSSTRGKRGASPQRRTVTDAWSPAKGGASAAQMGSSTPNTKARGATHSSSSALASYSSPSRPEPEVVSVQVVVRIRPLLERELLAHNESCVHATSTSAAEPGGQEQAKGGGLLQRVVVGSKQQARVFSFDHVADVDTTQHALYQRCVFPILQNCLRGYNATIFAYGQTGSGKTYTMGTVDNLSVPTAELGIIPRVLRDLFRRIHDVHAEEQEARLEAEVREMNQSMRSPSKLRRPMSAAEAVAASRTPGGSAESRAHAAKEAAAAGKEAVQPQQPQEDTSPSTEFELRVSYIEVYNERLKDLLHPSTSHSDISIRENARGEILLMGVRDRVANSYEEMMRLLARGSIARTTGSTLVNEASSRSHAIFTVVIRQRRRRYVPGWQAQAQGGSPPRDKGVGVMDVRGSVALDEVITSKLHLVDLAGSERNKKTGARGLRFKESIDINRGLLALGNVINGLSRRAQSLSHTALQAHIPYRQSKLTRLLQDSLGGNSRTLMIACVGCADASLEETLTTLKYASRARNIKNTAVANVVEVPVKEEEEEEEEEEEDDEPQEAGQAHVEKKRKSGKEKIPKSPAPAAAAGRDVAQLHRKVRELQWQLKEAQRMQKLTPSKAKASPEQQRPSSAASDNSVTARTLASAWQVSQALTVVRDLSVLEVEREELKREVGQLRLEFNAHTDTIAKKLQQEKNGGPVPVAAAAAAGGGGGGDDSSEFEQMSVVDLEKRRADVLRRLQEAHEQYVQKRDRIVSSRRLLMELANNVNMPDASQVHPPQGQQASDVSLAAELAAERARVAELERALATAQEDLALDELIFQERGLQLQRARDDQAQQEQSEQGRGNANATGTAADVDRTATQMDAFSTSNNSHALNSSGSSTSWLAEQAEDDDEVVVASPARPVRPIPASAAAAAAAAAGSDMDGPVSIGSARRRLFNEDDDVKADEEARKQQTQDRERVESLGTAEPRRPAGVASAVLFSGASPAPAPLSVVKQRAVALRQRYSLTPGVAMLDAGGAAAAATNGGTPVLVPFNEQRLLSMSLVSPQEYFKAVIGGAGAGAVGGGAIDEQRLQLEQERVLLQMERARAQAGRQKMEDEAAKQLEAFNERQELKDRRLRDLRINIQMKEELLAEIRDEVAGAQDTNSRLEQRIAELEAQVQRSAALAGAAGNADAAAGNDNDSTPADLLTVEQTDVAAAQIASLRKTNRERQAQLKRADARIRQLQVLEGEVERMRLQELQLKKAMKMEGQAHSEAVKERRRELKALKRQVEVQGKRIKQLEAQNDTFRKQQQQLGGASASGSTNTNASPRKGRRRSTDGVTDAAVSSSSSSSSRKTPGKKGAGGLAKEAEEQKDDDDPEAEAEAEAGAEAEQAMKRKAAWLEQEVAAFVAQRTALQRMEESLQERERMLAEREALLLQRDQLQLKNVRSSREFTRSKRPLDSASTSSVVASIDHRIRSNRQEQQREALRVSLNSSLSAAAAAAAGHQQRAHVGVADVGLSVQQLRLQVELEELKRQRYDAVMEARRLQGADTAAAAAADADDDENDRDGLSMEEQALLVQLEDRVEALDMQIAIKTELIDSVRTQISRPTTAASDIHDNTGAGAGAATGSVPSRSEKQFFDHLTDVAASVDASRGAQRSTDVDADADAHADTSTAGGRAEESRALTKQYAELALRYQQSEQSRKVEVARLKLMLQERDRQLARLNGQLRAVREAQSPQKQRDDEEEDDDDNAIDAEDVEEREVATASGFLEQAADDALAGSATSHSTGRTRAQSARVRRRQPQQGHGHEQGPRPSTAGQQLSMVAAQLSQRENELQIERMRSKQLKDMNTELVQELQKVHRIVAAQEKQRRQQQQQPQRRVQ